MSPKFVAGNTVIVYLVVISSINHSLFTLNIGAGLKISFHVENICCFGVMKKLSDVTTVFVSIENAIKILFSEIMTTS